MTPSWTPGPNAGSPRGRGPVMVIGGAEDKLGKKVVLTRFVHLAGGPDARIAVISTASTLGEEATGLYRELFEALGAASVTGLRPLTRDQADERSAAAALRDCTGIFLTGGNQLRLSSVVAGTALGAAITRAHRRGAVVAGTSAGASAVSTHMIAFGTSGPTPKSRMVQIAAGLGLLENVVIDQHFEQRIRLGRLLAVIAQSPALVGLGLDEDTAAIVSAERKMEVIGRGAVTVVDGSHLITDAFRSRGHRPIMVSGAILHSLPAGYGFDMRTRRLLAPPEPRVRRTARAAETASRRLQRLSRELATEGVDGRVGGDRQGGRGDGRRTEDATDRLIEVRQDELEASE